MEGGRDGSWGAGHTRERETNTEVQFALALFVAGECCCILASTELDGRMG